MQQLGLQHAATLDALPMLEEAWKAAAEADALRDPAMAMITSYGARRASRHCVEGGGAFPGLAGALARQGIPSFKKHSRT